ncbi:MAG: NifB/NifX family molybdenum-iron cluster-binding protein [Eubacteriales bacterium]|nr:NifB/NifX family molybdenum-iron cluster-binding protein [Eubacteriales bacterium]
MKIAAAYENGQVCQQFDETKQFKLYTIEQDRVVSMDLVDLDAPQGHAPRIALLKEQGAGLLVCGKISAAAQMELMQAGIAPFPGAYGDADMQVGALLVGMLESEKKVKMESCAQPEAHACETCAHRDQCGLDTAQ